jgi:glycosyltransferase involved in cell wall biosynthesis
MDHATVVLTSVDLETFVPATTAQRAETRRSVGLSPRDFVVFFAGRISEDKGVHVLVSAFRELVQMVEHCHLVVLGSPSASADPASAQSYTERLHRMADGLSVTWLPRRSDVVPLLQASDVAVVPSVWPEPLSRSILEPLSCGVPVVASRVGGSPEVLTGWQAEFLVAPGDPHDLARRLASLRDWRARDAALGKRCRQFAEEHLSPEREFGLIEETMLASMRATRR